MIVRAAEKLFCNQQRHGYTTEKAAEYDVKRRIASSCQAGLRALALPSLSREHKHEHAHAYTRIQAGHTRKSCKRSTFVFRGKGFLSVGSRLDSVPFISRSCLGWAAIKCFCF